MPQHSENSPRVDIVVYDCQDSLVRQEHSSTFGPYLTDEVRTCCFLILIAANFYLQRLLYQTAQTMRAVDVERIEGKAWVVHANLMAAALREACLQNEDCFYVEQYANKFKPALADLKPLHSSQFHNCQICGMTAHQMSSQDKHGNQKLQGLELFAGAGGLSAGMDQSGFVETQWVVEWTTSAALTYQYVLILSLAVMHL